MPIFAQLRIEKYLIFVISKIAILSWTALLVVAGVEILFLIAM